MSPTPGTTPPTQFEALLKLPLGASARHALSTIEQSLALCRPTCAPATAIIIAVGIPDYRNRSPFALPGRVVNAGGQSMSARRRRAASRGFHRVAIEAMKLLVRGTAR